MLADPAGRLFYGNAPADGGGSPAMGSSRDELNNNEQVHIRNPVVGKWTVSVQAKLLSERPLQNYSLVITAAGFVVRCGRRLVLPCLCRPGSSLTEVAVAVSVSVSRRTERSPLLLWIRRS